MIKVLKRVVAGAVILLVVLIGIGAVVDVFFGEEIDLLDACEEFSQTMLSLAQKNDVNSLVDQLTLYTRDGDERVSFNPPRPREDVERDVRKFLFSYSDLFDGEYVTYGKSTKKLPLGDQYELLVCVKLNDTYHGIPIENLMLVDGQLKVLDWLTFTKEEKSSFKGEPMGKRWYIHGSTVKECFERKGKIPCKVSYGRR